MADLFLLSKAQMRRIEPYFPLSHGIARVDDRRVISAIIYVIRNGLRDTGSDAKRCCNGATLRASTVRTRRSITVCALEPPWRVQQDFCRTGSQRGHAAEADDRHDPS
jgi:transposase